MAKKKVIERKKKPKKITILGEYRFYNHDKYARAVKAAGGVDAPKEKILIEYLKTLGRVIDGKGNVIPTDHNLPVEERYVTKLEEEFNKKKK